MVEELGDSSDHALVMKSTVPVGTGRSIRRRRDGPRLRLEPRVPQGGHGGRGLHEPRPRGGRRRRRARRASPTASPRCTSRSAAPIVRTDVASAEMIKLASNAFLATKISFINEIANVSEELGADVQRGGARDGPRRADRPEVPAGGHRLRRLAVSRRTFSALKQLAGNTGYHFQLLTAVIEVNELQKRRTIGKLQKHLGSLVGKEIALLGVAFKPNTDDIREATSLVLAGAAPGRGRARARLRPGRRRARARACSAARGSATRRSRRSTAPTRAVLVTEWPEFRELDWAGEVKRADGAPAGRRRPQLPRPRGAREPPASPTRASGGSPCRRWSSRAARAPGCARSPHDARSR